MMAGDAISISISVLALFVALVSSLPALSKKCIYHVYDNPVKIGLLVGEGLSVKGGEIKPNDVDYTTPRIPPILIRNSDNIAVKVEIDLVLNRSWNLVDESEDFTGRPTIRPSETEEAFFINRISEFQGDYRYEMFDWFLAPYAEHVISSPLKGEPQDCVFTIKYTTVVRASELLFPLLDRDLPEYFGKVKLATVEKKFHLKYSGFDNIGVQST